MPKTKNKKQKQKVKKSKWLYEFEVMKEEVSMESSTKTNKKGEKITTEKEVIKQVPVHFAIRRPTRKFYDDADLFYSVKLSEGIKAGLLTRPLLEKRFENDGGIFSEGDKDRYFELYRLVFEKENELQQTALNLEGLLDEEKNKKIAEVYTELTLLKRDLQEYESLYSSLFEQTAENRAKNSTVMWWVLHLSNYKTHKDGDYQIVFDGMSYDGKLNSYDEYEEAEEDHWIESIKKLVYFVSFWYSGNGQTEEDFKEAEEFYNSDVPEELLEEGSEEEEVEEEEVEEEKATEEKSKKAAPKKAAPKKRKPRKKKTEVKKEEPQEEVVEEKVEDSSDDINDDEEFNF